MNIVIRLYQFLYDLLILLYLFMFFLNFTDHVRSFEIYRFSGTIHGCRSKFCYLSKFHMWCVINLHLSSCFPKSFINILENISIESINMNLEKLWVIMFILCPVVFFSNFSNFCDSITFHLISVIRIVYLMKCLIRLNNYRTVFIICLIKL